jgi:glycosyltransferase involved in cell wall biosynthesis
VPAAPKRIIIVTNEILGVVRTGGSGTANTLIAFALAGAGHDVELLVTSPSGPATLDPVWAARYADRGVGVRLVSAPPHDVDPGAFSLAVGVQETLEQDPPDAAIVDAWSGTGYMALRLRELGLAFHATTFVVLCNGPTEWNYETDRKLPRSFPAFELEAIERASAALADAVVSPSAYLLEWLTERGWQLPRTFVAPYFTESLVGSAPVRQAEFGGRVRRIAFFGRLEERKGLAPFIDAVNTIDPVLITGMELLFVGRATPVWPAEKIEGLLAAAAKSALAAVRFETDLDQPEAIALLKQPGTVAVMPSLLDNSPNVVYECLDHGIPFLAADVGGIPELIAAEDRERTLIEPTVVGIRTGLERLLAAPDEIRPAQPGYDRARTLSTWEEALSSRPGPAARRVVSRGVTAIIRGASLDRLSGAVEALARQSHQPSDVFVVTPDGGSHLAATKWPLPVSFCTSLEDAAHAAREDLVVLLEEDDELEQDCIETLLRVQASSAADIVTCAARGHGTRLFFLGEANELGLVANY